MNSKKILVAALTAAVAVSSAVSVSAIAPGVTTAAVKQTAVVEPGKVTHFSITINDVTIDADVPADAVTAGEELTFGANTVTNVDIEAAVSGLTDVATSEILDVYFLDADGKNKSFENVGVDVTVTTTTTAYETIYIFEEGKGLNELAKADGSKLSFKAPHFSYYVLVKNGKVEPSQPSQQSNNGGTDVSNGSGNGSNNGNAGNNGSNGGNNGGVNTGDSSATVAVFGVIGAAALGTALVASKSKKSAK